MFKIHQVRLGLATNSSSSHSLVILPGACDQDAGEFGWNYFTAASQEAKGRYAAIQLRDTMRQISTDEVAHAVAEKWTGFSVSEDAYGDYIDHQSLWTLPLDWTGRGVDREFFRELYDFLMREDVVILGGNDNDGFEHTLSEGRSFRLGVEYEGRSADLVCRKDRGYWILFNRATGTKIRMSFGEDGREVTPVKALAPELVDIKITDYCTYGCSFCYQDSTVKGVHADMKVLGRIATVLAELRVFEVALGGGEPTLHPKFLEILQAFRQRGVVPNFTTKNLAWLHNHPLRTQVLAAAGAFAYSVDTARDVEKLAVIRDTYGISPEQLNCQYVMGSSDLASFEAILTLAMERDMRLTLLGYKTNGRGSQFQPEDYSDWIPVLKEVYKRPKWGMRLGIDTALAAQYEEQIKDFGIPAWCYEVEEGKFSMYIDAVAQKAAKSSYGSSLLMRPLKHLNINTYGEELKGEILEHFARY